MKIKAAQQSNTTHDRVEPSLNDKPFIRCLDFSSKNPIANFCEVHSDPISAIHSGQFFFHEGDHVWTFILRDTAPQSIASLYLEDDGELEHEVFGYYLERLIEKHTPKRPKLRIV